MSELLLFGEVGWEIKAQDVINFLNANTGEDIAVRLNSGGGDVYEGIAVMNALRSHDGAVTVIIEGLAASAASVIACGGASHVVIRPNAEVMIHEAWTWADGNAADLTKKVEDLNRASQNIADVYSARAGGSADEWRERMRAETWYSAQEALDAGLVDEIKDARKATENEPVAASYAPRMVAHFKYSGRRHAPAPVNQSPVGVPKEESKTMGLNALAKELGWEEDALRSALSRLKNESVPISGEVEVSYPSDVKIVPTEKIKIEPIIGDKVEESAEGVEIAPDVEGVEDAEPAGDSAAVQLAKQAGLTFAMGDVAEGFTAEVDEGGVVTVTAPSGAEVGSTAAFTVLVNETAVPLSVTVRSLSEEPDEDPAEQPAELSPVGEPAMVNKKVLDIDTYNELKAAAQFGWSAMEAKKESDLVNEVDGWIRDGRISAGLRAKAVAAMKRDPATARDLYGANPVNTIPRGEVGYGRQSADSNHEGAELRQKPNPFPKPKF
ncbi:head maturation protease, ClpP-related [Corynebacterium glutamicum]|uniref:head maturation protease, ClpP-related n=1 Tax=Corynebacterium glutamicum TaxID=1718 RepID=UPI003B5C161B